MKSVSEEYHMVVNVKGSGSFYVGLFNEGGGVNIFEISKSPIKTYDVLIDVINAKNILELTLLKDGYFDNYDNYFYVQDLKHSDVEEIKIMKVVSTTISETSYI